MFEYQTEKEENDNHAEKISSNLINLWNKIISCVSIVKG
jgi:hypothetical protein